MDQQAQLMNCCNDSTRGSVCARKLLQFLVFGVNVMPSTGQWAITECHKRNKQCKSWHQPTLQIMTYNFNSIRHASGGCSDGTVALALIVEYVLQIALHLLPSERS
ncbi:hypothetical protein scyTo_0010316 [Scyliorhinus torazame]|uniref:Uncharacterized protein n=1 Tax=Scyliorhinus torazame TaxID=75743 RepID=A0A401P423_SCYTO|nr:hypothetical protein [Scyliorhinus torazame]